MDEFKQALKKLTKEDEGFLQFQEDTKIQYPVDFAFTPLCDEVFINGRMHYVRRTR
jgi:hypothetical protein